MLDSVTSKFDAKSMQLEVVAVSLVGSIFEFIEKLYDFMVAIRFCFRSLSDNRLMFMSPRITFLKLCFICSSICDM